VMLFTVVLSVLAGLAFRKKLTGGNALFFITVASLIMPSIIVSLGIGLQFRLLDSGIKVRPMVLPDVFLDHDKPETMYALAGLDAASIVKTAVRALGIEMRASAGRA